MPSNNQNLSVSTDKHTMHVLDIIILVMDCIWEVLSEKCKDVAVCKMDLLTFLSSKLVIKRV